MVFDEIDVFALTGSKILKILIMRVTLPREIFLESERETKVSLEDRRMQNAE